MLLSPILGTSVGGFLRSVDNYHKKINILWWKTNDLSPWQWNFRLFCCPTGVHCLNKTISMCLNDRIEATEIVILKIVWVHWIEIEVSIQYLTQWHFRKFPFCVEKKCITDFPGDFTWFLFLIVENTHLNPEKCIFRRLRNWRWLCHSHWRDLISCSIVFTLTSLGRRNNNLCYVSG